MPTLQQRRDDVPRLFAQLVNEACARYRRETPHIPTAVFATVANREWPGNVRELRNAADRFALGLGLFDGSGNQPVSSGSLIDRVGDYERGLIAAELTANNGRLKETYEALGLSRKALYEKMKKYGLRREDFGADADTA